MHSESNHYSGTSIFSAVCDETLGCDSDFKNPSKYMDSLLIFSRLPTDTKELKTWANAVAIEMRVKFLGMVLHL